MNVCVKILEHKVFVTSDNISRGIQAANMGTNEGKRISLLD